MKTTGNQDQQEKNRKLSAAEQRRFDRFERLSADMVQQGYARRELTISIVKANVFAIILFIPLFVIGLGFFVLKNKGIRFSTLGPVGLVLFLVVLFALVVVHELIHGASWAIFTKNRFKDIEFGFMVQYLTPYCTCGVPLSKGQYIFGALMPMVLLGVVPMIVGILIGSFLTLLMGIVMTDAAAGDIMIVWNILRYKSTARDVVYVDHPTQGGGVIFEK